MRASTIPIVSGDGTALVASEYGEGESADAPVFVVLPAMGVRASFYEPLARALAEDGSVAVSFDLRGQGANHQTSRHFGYREIIEEDLPALLDVVGRRHTTRPLYVIAHSLGGQLATVAASRGLIEPDALVLIAAGTAHWRVWPSHARLGALLVVSGVALASLLLPRYPGRLLGFGGDQPRRLMRDWSYNAFTGKYRSAAEKRSLEPISRARRGPVLSLEIDGDEIAPAGAVESLLSRFEPTSVARRRLAPTPRSSSWARHFDWARDPGEVVDRIRSWGSYLVSEAPTSSQRVTVS